MKKIFSFFFLFLCLYLYAKPFEFADVDYKYIFEEALYAYEMNDFGKAIKTAEFAKNTRKKVIRYEVNLLENSFKPAEVKYAGDSLSNALKILYDRQDYEAVEIIQKYLRSKGEEFFEDSKDRLLNYIRGIEAFPECDILCAKIYRLEGEYEVAEKFYYSALENSALLDIPDQKYEILYSLCEIDLINKNYDKYEQHLLLIVSMGSDYKNKTLMKAMLSTVKSTDEDCMNKFFNLYRADNVRLLKAYFLLADFYDSMGHMEKALETSALGSLSAYTKILSVLRNRNPDIEFNGFSEVLNECAKYPDIVDWGTANNIWRGFNFFAEQAFKNQNSVFAKKLYSELKDSSPLLYWREEAAQRFEVIAPK